MVRASLKWDRQRSSHNNCDHNDGNVQPVVPGNDCFVAYEYSGHDKPDCIHFGIFSIFRSTFFYFE